MNSLLQDLLGHQAWADAEHWRAIESYAPAREFAFSKPEHFKTFDDLKVYSRVAFRNRFLFRRQIGFPPKTMAEIFRFQRFHRQWARGQSFDRVRDELFEYYYDQAHFTKEFKRMTGYSPRKFTHEVSNEFGRRLSLK